MEQTKKKLVWEGIYQNKSNVTPILLRSFQYIHTFSKSLVEVNQDPKIVVEPYPNPPKSPFGPQKSKNNRKIQSKFKETSVALATESSGYV